MSLIKCEYIDHMGNDLRVANAARVSFAKWREAMDDKDERLIDFLARNGHESPFMHCMLTVRVQAPIPIARQLWKSHIGLASQDDNIGWNEESRRYITTEPVFYLPAEWRAAAKDKKQGSAGALDASTTAAATKLLNHICAQALDCYNELLRLGVAPEQARLLLPQAAMTSWIWTGSLLAFVRICKLRLASDAQKENEGFAVPLRAILAEHFPHCVKSLVSTRTSLESLT